MNYIKLAIKSDYNVWIEEDRFLEFSETYFLDKSLNQHAKNMYLYNCIMAGWIKKTPQA